MPAPACAGLPIQQVLIVRIAAGEVLGRICREPGLLNYVTVWNWRRRNAGFDAEYREAQRQGRERRHWAFDEVRTERLLAGQRAGEKIMEIVARRGSPLGLRLYKHWMGAQAPFATNRRWKFLPKADAGFSARFTRPRASSAFRPSPSYP